MLNQGVIKEDLTKWISGYNSSQSLAFTDPSAQLNRQLYRNNHPTEFLVLKCMDGRLNLPLYTEIPPGILQPFRNIGGRFDIGWPFFQEVIRDSVGYAIGKGRRCVIMSSYHFSSSNMHRGCAGFKYDTAGAKEAALILREQLADVYGKAPARPVYALTIGMETDQEALVFHGIGGDLNVAELSGLSNDQVLSRLVEVYPDMDSEMRRDLLPLVLGNISHIKEVKASGKEPIDLEHREQIIAVGRGFDWLHLPNKALIIGPYSHAWPEAVHTAGTIALGNLKEGRIPEEHGILLLVAALWRSEEHEFGRRMKIAKVKYMRETAIKALKPLEELTPHIQVLSGVVDADTRKLHVLD